MVELAYNPEKEPVKGTWKLVDVWHPEGEEIKYQDKWIYTCCPDCGHEAFLNAHSVDAEGNAHPSLVCPYPPCTWHVFVKLAGWKEATGGAVKEPNSVVRLSK